MVCPTQDDLQAVMRLLDDAAIDKVAIGGGWARELSGLDEPRLHSDIDLVLTDADPERLARFMHAVEEIPEKHSYRKRAFMFNGVMVELLLVNTAVYTASEDCVATERLMAELPLADVLAGWRPGSQGDQWTWDDEEADILARLCCCCGQPGHYQQQLEAYLRDHGLTQGVCLGDDGRVWDGHHRIVGARRLGITVIPLESGEEAGQRWLRDHGPVGWHERKTGDRSPWEHEWREKAARGDFGPDEQAKVH